MKRVVVLWKEKVLYISLIDLCKEGETKRICKNPKNSIQFALKSKGQIKGCIVLWFWYA